MRESEKQKWTACFQTVCTDAVHDIHTYADKKSLTSACNVKAYGKIPTLLSVS